MSYTEALERLLGELQKLNAKVDALDERLRGLEDKGTEGAPPSAAPAPSSAEPPPLREGAFGPMVQRSDPTRHHRSVRQARALNGALPDAATPGQPREESEVDASGTARTSHQRALKRIRQMQTGPEPAAPAAPVRQVQPDAEQAAMPGPAEEATAAERVRWETTETASETVPAEMDLSDALAVDLATRPAQD